MRKFEMPSDYDTEKSEYAGQEPIYKNRQVVQKTSGEKVIILNYLKDVGLYVVMNIDNPGTVSPVYKIHPDKLMETKEDIKE